jgi:hypothetical protein
MAAMTNPVRAAPTPLFAFSLLTTRDAYFFQNFSSGAELGRMGVLLSAGRRVSIRQTELFEVTAIAQVAMIAAQNANTAAANLQSCAMTLRVMNGLVRCIGTQASGEYACKVLIPMTGGDLLSAEALPAANRWRRRMFVRRC